MKIKLIQKDYVRGQECSTFKGLYNSNGEKIYETVREDLIVFLYIEQEYGLIYHTQVGVRIVFNDGEFDSVEYNKDDTISHFTHTYLTIDQYSKDLYDIEAIIIDLIDEDMKSELYYEL